ncbi:hypothetical protein EDB80DRAFT_6004 [Ilyonectria destructans]|nr:hypothetical protein EDB80DRAFT_6004 [Ilyonectria destructans]
MGEKPLLAPLAVRPLGCWLALLACGCVTVNSGRGKFFYPICKMGSLDRSHLLLKRFDDVHVTQFPRAHPCDDDVRKADTVAPPESRCLR